MLHARSVNSTRAYTLAVALLLPICGSRAPAAADVTGEQVRRAIDRGVRYLERRQQPDGRWPERYYPGGETALITLALLQAGQSSGGPNMQAAIEAVRQTPDEHVYVVSLKIMVLAQADPQKYKNEVQAAARWLVDAQIGNGLWGYRPNTNRFDHSNSQFALLGLHAAAEAGARVSPAVWSRARTRVLATQNTDGGWNYRGRGRSYGSMTAANVSNLVIFGSTVAIPLERTFHNGEAPRCGRYRGDRALVNGLNWLGRHFHADENPNHGGYAHYWLYAVERAGILSGRRNFGPHEWYREGAEHLVRTQRADGGWSPARGGPGATQPIATALALLFLAKGHKPLLVQKLQWSAGDEWNPDRHDAKHLVAFIGDKLGEPTAWQVVDFDAPLEDWLAAPLLYMQGHEFPEWNDEQRAKMRAFVERGGTLFAEACCGRAEFRSGFEQFIADTFPEQPLRTLDAGHPVYSAYYDVPAQDLKGVDVGCRTSILYSPHDLSCLWEQRDVPAQSERAFRLGTNIAAYATGRAALRDRLDVVIVPEQPEGVSGALPSQDALRLAQIQYDGDWRPDANALVHFAQFLHEAVGLDVVPQYAAVRLTDEDALRTSPILYMTGHYGFSLSQAEQDALAAHLRRGGFLFADACCGRAGFDASFRALMAGLFPDAEFQPLPPDHPILRGQPGFTLRTVAYKPAVLAEHPDLDTPELWGLEIDNRLAVVYSPYALGCGLEGHRCYNCRGLLDADARRLAANIVLYALTH